MNGRQWVLAVVAFLLTATLAAAQPTIVQVTPVAGDPAASGTNLLNALAGITTASSSNPYVLKLHPGIYDVGAPGLQMKPYVDIEGSGQQSTIISGEGHFDIGIAVVMGASPAEIRNLQVLAYGPPPNGSTDTVAVWLHYCDTSVRDVTILASGVGSSAIGLRVENSGATILNATISESGGFIGKGIEILGTGGQVIRHTVINVANTTDSYGIAASTSTSIKEVRDVEINVTSSRNTFGFYQEFPLIGGGTIEIDNSTISANSVNAVGIALYGYAPTLVLAHSNVSGWNNFLKPGSSYGIKANVSSAGHLYADQSVVSGVTQSLYTPNIAAYVGSSRLSGTVSSGSAHCAASYNGSWVALGAGCV